MEVCDSVKVNVLGQEDPLSERNRRYLEDNKQILTNIPYLPNKIIRLNGKTQSLSSLYDYLCCVDDEEPELFSLFDLNKNNPEEWRNIYGKLDYIEKGGFDHGEETGNKYAKLQSDPKYFLSRKTGYMGLISLLNIESLPNKSIIIDLLAGNGTFSRIFKKLFKDENHFIIGLDVSKTMVSDALQKGEIVINSHFYDSILANHIADGVVSAYGTHHVNEKDRDVFIQSSKRILKKHRRVVIQDFLEGSPTARWYSEIIDSYRVGGHKYKHFTEQSILSCLKKFFNSVDLVYLYDPFYMEFDSHHHDEISVIRNFYAYLISLFSLKKMLPDAVACDSVSCYENSNYWKHVDSIFHQYFLFKNDELSHIINYDNNVPVVDKITVFEKNGKMILIAPRIALVGLAES